MIATEVGCMAVKPGLDIMDPSTSAGTILSKTWKTVMIQPGGPKRVFWGLEHDDCNKVWAFFDWDSVDHHQNFARSYGAEAVRDIPKVCTHGEFTKHITMVPSSTILHSPMTDVVLVYFPADVSTARKEYLSECLQKLLAKCFPHVDTKIAHAWGLENDFPVRGKEGVSGSVLIGFVGWSSDEAWRIFDSGLREEARDQIQGIGDIISVYSFSITCDHLERRP